MYTGYNYQRLFYVILLSYCSQLLETNMQPLRGMEQHQQAEKKRFLGKQKKKNVHERRNGPPLQMGAGPLREVSQEKEGRQGTDGEGVASLAVRPHCVFWRVDPYYRICFGHSDDFEEGQVNLQKKNQPGPKRACRLGWFVFSEMILWVVQSGKSRWYASLRTLQKVNQWISHLLNAPQRDSACRKSSTNRKIVFRAPCRAWRVVRSCGRELRLQCRCVFRFLVVLVLQLPPRSRCPAAGVSAVFPSMFLHFLLNVFMFAFSSIWKNIFLFLYMFIFSLFHFSIFSAAMRFPVAALASGFSLPTSLSATWRVPR